jgi:transglutaminase/protease-like cytokinesis protein 3
MISRVLMTLALIASTVAARSAAAATVEYRAHVAYYGWMEWVGDNAVAGTTGQSRQMEALTVQLTNGVTVAYQAHVASHGWHPPVQNGAVAGTTGLGLRMEAVKIWLVNAPAGAGICYTAHVRNIGWQQEVCNGAIAGTTGLSMRMEAIRIRFIPAVMPPPPATGNITASISVNVGAVAPQKGCECADFVAVDGMTTQTRQSSCGSLDLTSSGYQCLYSAYFTGLKPGNYTIGFPSYHACRVASVTGNNTAMVSLEPNVFACY